MRSDKAQLQLKGGSLTMFADDLLLHKVIHSIEDYLHIQEDVNTLAQWLTDYKVIITLNVKKCKSMLISRKVSSQISSLPLISLLNSPLDKVLSYRYLGVLITASLSWSDHITTVCSKARRQLGYLYKNNHVTPDTLKTLYIAYIWLLLEYAVPVWDPHHKKDVVALESIQRLASKICTKTWNAASYKDRLSTLNLSTLESRRKYLKLCYLYKLINNLLFFPNSPHYSSCGICYTIPCPYTVCSTLKDRYDSFLYSFFCHTPSLWNKLPSAVVSSSSLCSFKRAVMAHLQSH